MDDQLEQLLNFLKHARQDPSRGDAVFRCGFNGALDVVANRIREMQATDTSGVQEPAFIDLATGEHLNERGEPMGASGVEGPEHG